MCSPVSLAVILQTGFLPFVRAVVYLPFRMLFLVVLGGGGKSITSSNTLLVQPPVALKKLPVDFGADV